MLILTRKPGPPLLRFPAPAALALPCAANSQNPACGRPAADHPGGGAFRGRSHRNRGPAAAPAHPAPAAFGHPCPAYPGPTGQDRDPGPRQVSDSPGRTGGEWVLTHALPGRGLAMPGEARKIL